MAPKELELDSRGARPYLSVVADKSATADKRTGMRRHEGAGFRAKDRELARIARALCAPAKIAVLRVLARRRSCVCGEIVEITPLSQSTVSQHLKELKELGLIQGRVEGVKSCYCINREGFLRFAGALSGFLKEIKQSRGGRGKASCRKERYEKSRRN